MFQFAVRNASLTKNQPLAERVRTWNREHPALWIAALMFAASCLFMYGFGRAVRWTTGVQPANVCVWDCSWYSHTVRDGYDLAPMRDIANEANWAFFPLFPLSAKPVEYLLHVDAQRATVLAGKIEYFAAILAFLLWMGPRLESTRERFVAAGIVALNPYLIYGHTGYSEPLYFALCCFGFWALERRSWLLAGIFGASLSGTRFVGLAFALVYLIVVLHETGLRRIHRKLSLDMLLGLLLCPVGLLLFALYLHHRIGDALAFAHVQAAWGRSTANPLTVIRESLQQPGWFRVWAAMGVAGLLASAWLIRRHVEYGVFLALTIVIPLFSGVTWSLARYIWWQPPLLYVIFLALRRSAAAQTLYFAFTGGMASFMVVSWFSGNKIVI